MNFVSKFKARIERNNEIQKTIKELEACSDRELADIGVHRCEIGRIAREYHTDTPRNTNLEGWV